MPMTNTALASASDEDHTMDRHVHNAIADIHVAMDVAHRAGFGEAFHRLAEAMELLGEVAR